MKSIKPGRFNSGQNIVGTIIGIIFVIFWTISAVSMGAPIIFPVFGGGMLIMLVLELVKSIHNFTNKNRYSEFDIVDSTEEPDPWNQRYSQAYDYTEPEYNYDAQDGESTIYCPYCGVKLAPDFEYCPKCGKKLPF